MKIKLTSVYVADQEKAPPTDVTTSRIAMVNDSCGNLIQVTQLKR